MDRFIVHSNTAFEASNNFFLGDFFDTLRPSYQPPSAYVLSHRLLDAEKARVQLVEMGYLKASNFFTLLFDGWEDRKRRSIYGTVAAQLNMDPIILGLEELTGKRATAQCYLETIQTSMRRMDVGDGKQFIALTTDNPSVMQLFRSEFQKKFYWVLVSKTNIFSNKL
jgi:hypothetical protein